MSQSQMYVKSNKAINLNTGVFDWNNMTSSTSIKINDGTGIFIQTPNLINLQSNVINLRAVSVYIYMG